MKLFVKTGFQLLLILMGYKMAWGQAENNKWIIGSSGNPFVHSVVDFNLGVPDTSSCISSLVFFLTNASICDSTGQLLFYTNGHVIYNQNHDSLYNTSGINPGWATSYYEPYGMGLPQGAFIIPQPGHSGQYLMFYESAEFVTLDSVTSNAPINLGYSIIDMSLDGGLGGIALNKKNLIAVDDTLVTGRITGVKHANGRDWWILVHHYNDSKYYKVLITPDTVINYSSQNIGRLHLFERYVMQSCFSPQGDKFVMGLTVNKQTLENIVDLFDFDRCTGLLSNHRGIEIPDTVLLAAGCSFSPSGRFLYVSTNNDMYQFDTWSSNINSTRLVVSSWDSTTSIPMNYYHHLLAPDQKIYVTNYFTNNVLHVINAPDVQGPNCDLVHGQLELSAYNCFMMPNSANYSLGSISGSPCDSLTNIADAEVPNFKTYPNPVLNGGFLNVVFDQTQIITRIRITNAMGFGREVYLQNKNSSEIKIIMFEKPGMYFLEIATNNNTQVTKFIVN